MYKGIRQENNLLTQKINTQKVKNILQKICEIKKGTLYLIYQYETKQKLNIMATIQTLTEQVQKQKKLIKSLVNKKVDWKKESELISDIRINQNRLYKLQIQLLEEKSDLARTNYQFDKIQKEIEKLKSKLLK